MMVGLLEEPYKSRVFQYGYCTMLQSCLLFGCLLVQAVGDTYIAGPFAVGYFSM
jgi:hypothetical protein